MHKFTYLLSDSYRQEHNSKLKASNYVQQSQVRGFSQSNVGNSLRLNRQVANPASTNQSFNAISSKYRQNINPLIKIDDFRKEQIQLHPKREYIQRKLTKIQDGGSKHRVIFNNKELQNKLKMISDKYAQQYKLNRNCCSVAKQEVRKYDYKVHQISSPVQQKIENNKFPQRLRTDSEINETYQRYNRKPLNQNNSNQFSTSVPKYQLKTNVNDYLIKQNYQKEEKHQPIQKYQFMENENRQPTEAEQSRVNNYQTVAKLSSLQSRIQSSIKPYLNL